MKNATTTAAKSPVTITASGKTLNIVDTKTGAKIVLTVEDGQLVRDMSGAISHHDYQYGGNIAHYVAAVCTQYMNKRLGWADRLKKIAKASEKINAKSIRNMSSKLRVVTKPMFGIPQELFFAEQVKA